MLKAEWEKRRALVEEGLVRADYLLPAAVQEENREQSKDKHSKNYWTVMKRIGAQFRENTD